MTTINNVTATESGATQPLSHAAVEAAANGACSPLPATEASMRQTQVGEEWEGMVEEPPPLVATRVRKRRGQTLSQPRSRHSSERR